MNWGGVRLGECVHVVARYYCAGFGSVSFLAVFFEAGAWGFRCM